MKLVIEKAGQIKKYLKKRLKLYKPLKKYDEEGNLVYVRFSDGHEAWAEYNFKDNRIGFKDTEGRCIVAQCNDEWHLLYGKKLDLFGRPYSYFLPFEENLILSSFLNDKGEKKNETQNS